MAAYPSRSSFSTPSLATAHLIVVRRRNLRWEVSLDGVTRRMVDWLCTRERAVEHALEMARELASPPAGASVRVVVQDLDGVARTFGPDSATLETTPLRRPNA